MRAVKNHRSTEKRGPVLCALVLAVAVLAGPALAANDPKASRFYEDALKRFENKDHAGAIVQLKNALQIDRNNLAVQVLMGKASLATGQVVAAEVAFNDALKLGVDRAEVVVPLGRALVAQGKHKELFENSRFDPSGLPGQVKSVLLLVLASAKADLGDAGAALRLIEQARAIDPGALDAWLAEIPVRILGRQFREAAAAADKALAIAPKSAEAHYQRGSIAHATGQLEPAQRAYDKALEFQADHVEALVARAGLLLDLGRTEAAERDLAALKKAAPDEPRAAFLRALLAERRGDGPAARAALAGITGLMDPVPLDFIRYRPQLLTLAALAHAGLDNSEKAKPYLEALLRIQPGSSAAKLLARIQLNDRNVELATATLETYLRVHPGDSQAVALLASAFLAQGRHARATQLMQAAMRVDDSAQMRTMMGMSLLGARRPADAATEFEAAFKKDPSRVEAATALVFLSMQAGKTDAANAAMQQLIKHRADHAGVQNLAGMLRVANKDTVGARAAFERAAKLDPAFDAPVLNLARLDAAAGQADPAVARLRALLARNERHVEALLELGRIGESRGQTDDARMWLEKAEAASASEDIQAAVALVEFHLRGGRAEAAMEARKKLAARAPNNPRALIVGSRALLAGGDTKGALTQLSNAGRLASYDAKLLLEVALLQAGARDLAAAAYTLDKALQVDPHALAIQALKVDVDLRRGEHAAAEARAREVAAKHPKKSLGHSLLGDVALVRGQAAVAAGHYQRALQVEPRSETLLRQFRAQHMVDAAAAVRLAEQWLRSNPKDGPVMRALADAHAAAGRYPQARAGYEALLKVHPADADAWNNLANVLVRMNDPAAALKAAEAAQSRSPASAHILGTLGWAAFHAGQVERALQALRDARLRDPANADTRYFLATVLASNGRGTEARDELQTALREGRGFAHEKQARALLDTLR
jgi:putative PEP-CTERM system TPR-repeat lipoprotein